jgi:signal transduction histidine kinase/ActR/RegA family two-component response regulator
MAKGNEIDAPATLESILCTAELNRRPSRPPDYETENRALTALGQALADSPETILQTLADVIVETFQSGSGGVSLLTKDGERFYWPAIAGAWRPHLGGGTPRNFGPCGDVLDRNVPLLFKHVERRYRYFEPVKPPVEECLLVPFYVEGKPVGTIWAVAHDRLRKFDAEDMRQLVSLGRFASAAYQVWSVMHALEEADRRKNEFLAMVAHELRGPLAPIHHALQIMRLAAGRRKAVNSAAEVMARQVGQMTRLVDDLLDVSRISQGKIELRKYPIDLASVVNQAVEAARPAITRGAQELTIVMPSQPIHVEGDAARLAQVVGNLLNNACKFTAKDGRIRLTAEQSGDQAVIRVQDNGIGIATEQLSRIFEMFAQVDTSLERSQSGLGLGLPLVKNFVEMHSGTVEAHSAGLGQGSEFTVRLPLMVEAPTTLPAQPTVSETTAIAPRRILVVDDNQDSATSLAMLLKLTGNETHTAFDGLEAMEAAATFRPDVVLLDIGLPKLNGYETARKIREQPWGKDVVLVALTGWGQDEDLQKSKAAGFNDHFIKPVNHEALMKLLAENPRTGSVGQ